MTLIIDHESIPSLITMQDAVRAVAEAYAALARGEASESARNNLLVPSGWIRTMSAAHPAAGYVGYKEFHRFNGISRYAYHLFDAQSGEQVALTDGRYLTALRTGAAGGLAIRELTADDASSLGVIGTGAEARAQVEAVLAVRQIKTVRVYSRNADRRDAFCEYVNELAPNATAEAVSDPRDAARDVEILVVATNTAGRGPALYGASLPTHPLHINSIGSTLPNQREIDEQVWKRSARVVIDSPDVLSESGDAIAAERGGFMDKSRIIGLGDLLMEGGRGSAGETTLYKSVGSAIQDLAMAIEIHRAAKARGGFAKIAPFQAVRTVDVPQSEQKVAR